MNSVLSFRAIGFVNLVLSSYAIRAPKSYLLFDVRIAGQALEMGVVMGSRGPGGWERVLEKGSPSNVPPLQTPRHGGSAY
jgi:hypothetical protein